MMLRQQGSIGVSSLARTGLKAGAAFLVCVAIGALAALLLGVGGAALYFKLIHLGDGPAAHTGTVGAIIALLFNPRLLIGVLLSFFFFLYLWLGFFYGPRRALASVVALHGGAVADRLAATLAKRLASAPRSENAAGSVRQWLAEDNVAAKVEAISGDAKWTNRLLRLAVKRLPWNELLTEWNAAAKDHTESESLQAALSSSIARAMIVAVSPSWYPIIISIGAQIALFVTGVWVL
jgi:hypothetical protein